jgi:hypothetical protein
VALEINCEVSLVVLCVDGVHDGLQRITASPKTWSTIFRAPCNGDEGWLELDVPADVLWARRRPDRRRYLGSGGLTRGFRRKRQAWWRGLRGQSSLEFQQFLAGVLVRRQQDLLEIVFLVLVRKS